MGIRLTPHPIAGRMSRAKCRELTQEGRDALRPGLHRCDVGSPRWEGRPRRRMKLARRSRNEVARPLRPAAPNGCALARG